MEKASTYVFAERLIRNAEVRGSIPLCSTNRINDPIDVGLFGVITVKARPEDIAYAIEQFGHVKFFRF